jgi:hypothetical protein
VAHLSVGEGGDRGQLLLVAVLVLAASFIVLALVINSAIFTENLATREDVGGSEKALEYRAEVLDSVGASVIASNEDTALSDIPALEDSVRGEVATLRTGTGRFQAVRGGIVEVTYGSSTEGQRIAQDNATRNLTDRDGTADWTVAEDVENVRRVRFELRDIDTSAFSNAFEVELENSGTWTLSVSDDGLLTSPAADEVAVTVETGTGDQAECIRNRPNATSPLTIDVTGGTINEEPCHALNRQGDGTEMWLGTGVSSPFDIEFENADNVNGTYSMVVDDGATVDTSSVHSGYDPDEPHVRDALYAVELSYVYQNHAVAYEDTIRVAPGEVPP